MSKTNLTIKGTRFHLNGKPVYSEIQGCPEKAVGTLMNARFIQGIFDDKADPRRFARFGQETWDPAANTKRMIASLEEWHSFGLRAITVGMQGGGPCFTVPNHTIENNPFGEDGLTIDQAYLDRMLSVIKAADELGMVVIVSFFYPGQVFRFRDGGAIRRAVTNMSVWLKEIAYTNVIIEICNEYNLAGKHPILNTAEGISSLIDLARSVSGGIPSCSSGGGGHLEEEVAKTGDIVMIHGNGCSRQKYQNLVLQAKKWGGDKPVVCNEDSQMIGQIPVALAEGTSWGYYNNITKQEPPCDWSVTKGEDEFFALRTALELGMKPSLPAQEDRYYLQGLEPLMTYEGKRWPRVASLYPETIDYVDFELNGKHVYRCYDEPFTVNWSCNWNQGAWMENAPGDSWTARIALRDGSTIEKKATLS